MSQFAAALQAEIRRLARKEVKALTAATKKGAARSRREIASLKRLVRTLERRLGILEGLERTRTGTRAVPTAELNGKRFSGKWLRAHRKRLKISAVDYGRLVGLSGLSIYKLERGDSKPRQATMATLIAAREMGRREAVNRLALKNGK